MEKQSMSAALAAAAGLDDGAGSKTFTESDVAKAADAARAEGIAMSAAERDKAVKAERERIAAIQDAAFPGQKALADKAIADGISPGDAALIFNADHKAKGAQMLANLRADEKAMQGLASEYAPANADAKRPAATGEAAWKAEYAGSAELQAEFRGEAAYLAFRVNEAAGNVRYLTREPKRA